VALVPPLPPVALNPAAPPVAFAPAWAAPPVGPGDEPPSSSPQLTIEAQPRVIRMKVWEIVRDWIIMSV
jgi:hypothetical protein